MIDLAGRRVGVTGAGGFIGTALCARLAAAGAEVTGIELDSTRASSVAAAGAEFRQADVTDAAALADALGGAEFVVHTAAIIDERAPMEAAVKVNVRGTSNALAAARGAERFVHLSSVAAFAFEARRELSEEAYPRRVGSSYFDTKAASEELARRHGATIVRPGDVYGPGSVPWALRPLELARSGKLILPAGGEGLMTLVYVDDLVDATFRALVVPAAARGAFNAWDGAAVTTREFFGYFARMAGKQVRTAPDPLLKAAAVVLGGIARVRGVAPDLTLASLAYISRRHAYSTEQARSVLGWEPEVMLADGMARTEAWFRAEGLLT